MSNVVYKISHLQPMKKEALSNILRGIDSSVTDSTINSFTKQEIVQAILDAQTDRAIATTPVEEESTPEISYIEESIPSEDFEQDIPDEMIIQDDENETSSAPSVNDPEWTDWVLSFLNDNEKQQDHPTVDGLRRIFEIIVGEIIETRIDIVSAPTISNNRAVAECTITYFPHGRFFGSSIQDLGQAKIISDAADCYWGNTKKPYCDHTTATAASMSEGRCLRKAMRIKVLTNEEALSPEGVEAESVQSELHANDPASDNQKNAIIRIASRVNIDVEKLVRSTHGIEADTLDRISSQEAHILIRLLNDYQKKPEEGGIAIPSHLFAGTNNE